MVLKTNTDQKTTVGSAASLAPIHFHYTQSRARFIHAAATDAAAYDDDDDNDKDDVMQK